jgi:protein TonB
VGPPVPQHDPPALVTQPDVFVAVEHMPELIGGLASIQPVYPDMERRVGIEGRVVVQFVVNEDGAVSDIVVMRGVNAGLDRAAVEAVRRARFLPGIQAGRPVKVRLALPINFRLK